ncbi:MAG: elongation factor 4 [Candidatus Yanofskybacteria bacterium CG10_big_fil_rev_8_21_14_0_10_36_16]|uniref:Elongation factor 4 n=1 Tax=Candidatus Yanofskybacteria bacterium CG10_big_fil_rev_8_21_14_0_10_36_16 TaxID=1975096 RepID=A0A2J0QBX1_9BACT|nr:MAG: elongation factor 4 [Candidatus Yanofskybacteria bacterium CG10_big_fil_rev_8_21_14_0_10_36_16]
MLKNTRNFVIIAHIDHGKSTLADRLLDLTETVDKRQMKEQFLDQMELERERGITIKLQPVRMKYKTDYILNLIDTPGHVDFSYEVSRSLAAVEGAILLVDATKGIQAQTLANYNLAKNQALVIIPVINKIDLPNARTEEVEKEVKNLLSLGMGDDSGNENYEVLKISAKTGNGVEKVLEEIVAKVPPPSTNKFQQDEDGPFRALIFDSSFDSYKGVIAYVRVFGGKLKAGQQIRLSATKVKTGVIEVGYFSPLLLKKDEIFAGDMGYIATGFKDPGFVRVGDTVLGTENIQVLPGYKEPRPMVFASFYPENGDDYDELKDALSKIKLTDASLVYEPESSPGLGRGFRLGFLGMLHVEIVSERLKREYNLSLIVSTPSVEYHVLMKNKNKEIVRSAASMPDPSRIEGIEEPVVDLEILSPSSYLGQLMTLMADLRNEYVSTDYLGKEVVVIKYKVPLAEIITDFYDKLKSVSSGYASMSYGEPSYQMADLVRMDILVAGDLVEPFSKIVPREKAYNEGKTMVEKLKDVIPRQLFTVALQAAIGGKIIARETIKAQRKDVTGYLYGGDITRKKKLLEKQKKGKKKMKEIGKVNIPQKVFLEMLKR